jgi:regulator of sigma E protease
MITILSLTIALSILVFVHELGHFLAAKRTGVVVEEFAMGYPPRLWTLWRSPGEIVVAGQRIVIPRGFKLPDGLRARSLVIYQTAQDDKGNTVLTCIAEVDPATPEAVAARRVDRLDPGTIYSINAIPFGGFTKMLGEEDPTFPGSLASKSKRVRALVLVAGSAMNLLVAVFFFALVFGLGAPAAADPQNAVIQQIMPGSPAEAAGLLPGDIAVQVDDTPILAMQDLISYTQTHLGQELVLTVERGDEVLTSALVPRVNPPEGEGAIGVVLGPRTTIKHYPWYEALWLGLKQTGAMIVYTVSVPVQLIRGLIPADLVRPVGLVGIGQLVGDAVQYTLDTGWWYPVMQTMGLLSVAVALTNLLPLPGLDGGRLLFVILEAIRRRRIDPAKEGLVHLVGMLLLVALMFFLIWQDIAHPLPSVDWGGF